MEETIRVVSADESSSAITNRVDLFSLQSSNLSDGVFSPDQLVQAFNNFKKSGVPSRFLLFSEDAWAEFAHQVFDELKVGFLAGKTILEVTVDQKSYLFDFLRMIRIDSETSRQNSIAWIDVHGRCFFPKKVVYDRGNPSHQAKLELGRRRINKNLILMSSPQFHRHDPVTKKSELFDENMEVSSDRWPGAKMLRDDDKLYKIVEKLFLSGINRFIPNTVITSINRCSTHSSLVSSFKLHKSAAMESRGNANVKFGWYGTSASNIAGIMSSGFREPNNQQLGLAAHGIGIHLSPPHYPYGSALLSEADEDGERHIILCRVIMGNSEKVEAGSTRNHPSNERFDSGVDDIENPKWFVVWSSHMNTHIVPEYIVSFKSSGQSQGWRKPEGVQKFSSVMNLPFWKLFSEIEKSLPASKMQALEILYNQYKVRKISKEIFIRYMRSIAGDKLLISTIKSMKG